MKTHGSLRKLPPSFCQPHKKGRSSWSEWEEPVGIELLCPVVGGDARPSRAAGVCSFVSPNAIFRFCRYFCLRNDSTYYKVAQEPLPFRYPDYLGPRASECRWMGKSSQPWRLLSACDCSMVTKSITVYSRIVPLRSGWIST